MLVSLTSPNLADLASLVDKHKINMSEPDHAGAKRYLQTLDASVTGFESSVRRHMPASPYRDYCLWAMSSDNPRRDDYLQTVGIIQLVNLTVMLLDDLIGDDDWEELTDLSVVMNAYLIHEAASDNLANGLRNIQPRDTTFRLRKNTLYTFNGVMLKCLDNDDRQSAIELLESIKAAARRISNFEEDLKRDKHVHLVQTYLSQRPDVSLDDLEYSTWPNLVANIESCIDFVRATKAYCVGSIIREGLVNRYYAVNKLLKAGNMTLSQLANVGTHSILVMPTLAYYIALLAEVIEPQPRISLLVADGTLGAALYDAALLLRLLNDLGTEVCTLTPEERVALLHQLTSWHHRHSKSTQTIFDVLAGVADEDEPGILTRLRKDVLLGEFNVGLYSLASANSVSESILAFGRNIDYFVQLYAHHYARLEEKLAIIDACLGTDTISELILRFVKFHERMYTVYMTTMQSEA